MNCIYFINEKISIKGLSQNQSFELQKETLLSFIQNRKFRITKLNPSQLHEHYTIPHALYYDLKMEKMQIDCLLLYSAEVIEDFVKTYPARWLMLKSFFNEVITVAQPINQLQL